jgi:hypothetical protein
MTVAKWRKFDTQILRFCAGELKDRAAPELVRGRYTLLSKNDGDTSFPDAPVGTPAAWRSSPPCAAPRLW